MCVPLFVVLGALGIAADEATFRFCGASASDAARAASFMLPLWTIAPLHASVGAWGWLGFCAGLVIARLIAMLIAGVWLHRIRLVDWIYAGKQLSRSVPVPRA